ncbi:MAG: type II toxin-antitoxin system VapC family toxin [Candidatus Binatia bacterium]
MLDTHALVWALGAPRKLPPPVMRAITDPVNEVYVSAASTWELAIKAALGRIDLDMTRTVEAAEKAGFAELAIRIRHTARVRLLPMHHRDPFDRILIAQAAEEGLTLVTRDSGFRAYGVPVLWHE